MGKYGKNMTNIKKTILWIVTTAVISGGLVVGFQKPKKLTMEQARILRKIYTYEIQKRGKITLHNVNRDNLISKLQAEIEKTPVSTSTYGDVIKIDGVGLKPTDYALLRSGLFKVALHKSLIEQIIK